MKNPSPKLKAVVVGSGVVGKATGVGILNKGKDVAFIDVSPNRIAKLRNEGLTSYTPSKLKYSRCECDLILLSVPTPTFNQVTNLSFLQTAANDVGEHLSNSDRYHVVVVRSTVLPGTTENLVIKTLEKISHKKVGRDFGVCMNPEYLREKTAVEDFTKPWIIVIGEYDKTSGDKLFEIYQHFDAPIFRLSIKEAEIQKYIHNLFNAAKISFFNEFRDICQKIGADPEQVFPTIALSSEGIWNHMYGLKNFGPFSGMCLPKDTQAFLTWAENFGWEMPMLSAAIKVNDKLIRKQLNHSRENGNGHTKERMLLSNMKQMEL